MLTPIVLGPVVLNRPALLAPMAGVTDAPFRAEAQAFGAPYTVSEMVAGDQLAQARPDMVRRAAGAGRIGPLAIQLAGREARWMARGAELAADAGADVIDINMGCPAKSVTSGASGAALMREPDLALSLIEAAVAATSVPVTLKMRLGWDETCLNAPALARRAEAAGVRMIVVHGRTRRQFYTGVADWRAIAEVVQAVKIPVIANGDITSTAAARAALAQSGAAGVMIGRGAQGRPWLPAAIAAELAGAEPVATPGRAAMLESLLRLHEASLEHYGLALGLRTARKHIAWTIDAVFGEDPAIRAERSRITRLESAGEVRRALQALFVAAPLAQAA